MEKFKSIESLKHLVANVRRYCNEKNIPLPTLHFEGTVKLHGTNGGIRRMPDQTMIPQSRERLVTIANDNAGFAVWFEGRKNAWKELFDKFYPGEDDVTVYGEWCGGNIQKSVALQHLPKHFVIFKATVNGEYKPVPRDMFDNDNGIYNIYQIPTYNVEIDFMNPAPASEIIADLTLEVEKHCPWAVFMGADGECTIGEGIVWSTTDLDENLGLWFKTKGLLHKGNDKTKVPKIKISDEKLESIKATVDEILPQWRLEQGISYLRENGLPLLPESTGDYLKWIAKDILKEETDTIAASGFEWKQLQGEIMRTAKQYFMIEINKVD